MKKNPDRYISEFLYRFYRKRTASFLANVYKAGITGASKDIHKARLDVKKIMAILDLLRIVRSGKEKDPGYERIFKKLYQASGRIREIQVNQLLVTKSGFGATGLSLYRLELQKQERDRTREFLQVIRKFREKRLTQIEGKIRKEIFEISSSSLKKKTSRYVDTKTAFFTKMLDKVNDEKALHIVRQHLKELSTILTLVLSVKFSGKFEQIVERLNETEIMIGNWHDHAVLADSITDFLDRTAKPSEQPLEQIRNYLETLVESNRKEFVRINSELDRLIDTGLFPDSQDQMHKPEDVLSQ